MRISVFSRGANPRIDRPILRKSLSYATEQVENLLADWVDPGDPGQGIIAREFLPSSKHLVETADVASVDWAEIPGIKYVPAKMEKNSTLARLQTDQLSLRLLRKEKQMTQRALRTEQQRQVLITA